MQDIINATTPGRARDFCSMLLRPPHQGRLDPESSVRLVRKCFGFSSMKGRISWYVQELTQHRSISDCARVYLDIYGDGATFLDGSGSARRSHRSPGTQSHLHGHQVEDLLFQTLERQVSTSYRQHGMHACSDKRTQFKQEIATRYYEIECLDGCRRPSPPLGVHSYITEPS